MPAPTPSGVLPHSEALLRRLEWTVIRRLDGWLQGDHRTLWRGSGLDLADLREYQPGDDVRRIDWNVTARLDQPHVRQYTEERDHTAWFVLDLSASVDFGSNLRTKREVAREFVGVLARLLTRHGDRVGALFCTTQVDAVLAPGRGRTHVLELLQRLAPAPPPRPAGVTDLGAWLRVAQRMLRRRASVFVVSDFISTPDWAAPLGELALRHEVTAVRLVDPLERALPDIGLVTLRDAEAGETLLVDTHDRGFRARFAAAARAREDALRDGLARAGVDALELGTGDDVFETLMRFADLRRSRGRRSGGAAGSRRAAWGALAQTAPARA